jgi:TetR/AcrR family transcriptional repressor of nem operon
MTRGAFYSHFKSKAELYTEAMTWAGIRRFRYALGSDSSDQPTVDSAPPSLNRLVETYLSEEHVSGQHGGCPMASILPSATNRYAAVTPVC